MTTLLEHNLVACDENAALDVMVWDDGMFTLSISSTKRVNAHAVDLTWDELRSLVSYLQSLLVDRMRATSQ